ncbi:adenosylcobinamide-phosphate synthase [Halomonas shengliensis]|uniref:Cobalamin biosynthesis protein CobD n=1 Tax=Halomonas shengliensis TaxID=419597 RepID=A0A1H0IKC7_9GAMM|nr:adenosylcobinamide-phosphate synthase CbiB [Halomonas shengliensis]SDO31786.1 adenosylcobinamide-phosphate synthase [Halomonas shengliensis]
MAEPLSPALLALVLAAVVLDLTIGDPRRLPHPVVGMGAVIVRMERAWNHGSPLARRRRGALMTALVVAGSALLAWGTIVLLANLHPWLGWLAEGWLLASCLAIRGLRDAALSVAAPLARGDLPAARQALSLIVGRDTEGLDEGEVTRGAVETVAENTVDGITAPLLFALLGGAPLAVAYKAVNTLDSMVGYRSERYRDFGRASARLDDAANWLPARLTALTLWLGALCLARWERGLRTQGALAATRREAPRHPSPNSGWPEAMVANLLGVQLGGTNRYRGEVSERARLGTPREPLRQAHIGAAIRLMHGGWLVFLILLSATVLFGETMS